MSLSKYLMYALLLFVSVVAKAEDHWYAIYSGSFDPPTLGHKAIIEKLLKDDSIDRVYVVVNRYAKKTFKASIAERMEMVSLMFKNTPEYNKLVVLSQDSPNKMGDYITLKKILRSNLILVTGEDSYLKSLNIPEGERIRFDKIAVVPRGKDSKIETMKVPDQIMILKIDPKLMEVSSSNVRKKLIERDFKDIDIDKNVVEFIKKHNLYMNMKDLKVQQEFEDKFYEYIGRLVKGVETPEYIPESSRKSWNDQYYKYYYDNHLDNNTCLSLPTAEGVPAAKPAAAPTPAPAN